MTVAEKGYKDYTDLFAPAFWRAWNDIFYHRVETVCAAGGRGSGKSSFVSEAMLLKIEMRRRQALALREKGDKNWNRYLTHAACFRKVGATLADSCFNQFIWAADQLNLTKKYIFTKNPLSVTRKGTGQKIYFRGLDDPMKARSLKPPFSYCEQLWFEELSEFSNIEEVQDVTRSIQRGGHDFMTYYSYNPPETTANWVNYSLSKLEDEDPTFRRYLSDYRSINPDWLGPKFFRDAEIMRRMNERAYRHIYLGEITGNGGTVFPNVRKVHLSDDVIAKFDNIRWGADFGLTDPTVLVGMQYSPALRTLIIFDEYFQSNATFDEIETNFKRHHFGWEYIIGDSAASHLIYSLRSRGIPILEATKGPGSILNQVKFLQGLTAILIDPIRCPNTYREFINYEYEKNRAGEFMEKLPETDNHSIDATRYAIEKLASEFDPFMIIDKNTKTVGLNKNLKIAD